MDCQKPRVLRRVLRRLGIFQVLSQVLQRGNLTHRLHRMEIGYVLKLRMFPLLGCESILTKGSMWVLITSRYIPLHLIASYCSNLKDIAHQGRTTMVLRTRVVQERLRMICLCSFFCIWPVHLVACSMCRFETSIDDVSEWNQANLKMVAKDTQIYDDSQSRPGRQSYLMDRDLQWIY